MGHDLTIIVLQSLIFIGLCGINKDVIHLLILVEHQCHAHCLNMNVICLFILLDMDVICLFMLFTHKNYAHDFHV